MKKLFRLEVSIVEIVDKDLIIIFERKQVCDKKRLLQLHTLFGDDMRAFYRAELDRVEQ